MQGELALVADDHEAAARHLEEAADLLAALDRREQQCQVLVELGQIHSLLGRLDRAGVCLERARTLSRACGDRQTEAYAVFGLGMHHETRRRSQRAREHFREARMLFEATRDLRGLGYAHLYLGTTAMRARELAEARAHLLIAKGIFADLRESAALANVSIYLGDLLVAEGMSNLARAEFDQGLAESVRLGFVSGQAHALLGIAMLTASDGHLAESKALFTRARALYASVNDAANVANTYLGEGKLMIRAGFRREGADLLGSAFDRFAEAGCAPGGTREHFIATALGAVARRMRGPSVLN
jgi:tetratricopeptide (TPR) repeat protein